TSLSLSIYYYTYIIIIIMTAQEISGLNGASHVTSPTAINGGNNNTNTTNTNNTNNNNKRIYLIRHGQSTFNAAYQLHKKDPFLFDAMLTELGEQQANSLADHVAKLTDIELVVSSPLSRALDTTRRGFSKAIKERALKVEVITLHSEYVQTSDDTGRERSIVQKEFPDFDLSHIQERWWYLPEELKHDMSIDTQEYFKTIGYKENLDQLQARMDEFKAWLMARQENTIAVVGHSEFFYYLMEKKLPYFKNCQILQWDMNTNDAVFLS
ncbi:hypothetical protein SAMD00019534_076710, partial [Acytostelium subglobosum LB1]|uniref:hypothetical protein n=1 Tax=Acytostelium subglobosum LB1 TaxID=1410327 RepID=UPI000644E491